MAYVPGYGHPLKTHWNLTQHLGKMQRKDCPKRSVGQSTEIQIILLQVLQIWFQIIKLELYFFLVIDLFKF